MAKQTVVTFSGKAQHGKDLSLQILKNELEKYGKRVLNINYSNYLKYLASQHFGWDGNKDEKGRTLLQWLGTEKIRNRFPDFWVDAVMSTVMVFEDDYDYVLIGDCRFPNEITKWIQQGYTVVSIHVERLNFENDLTDSQRKHSSENALEYFKFNEYIKVATAEDLEKEIRHVAKRIL